MSKTHPLWKGMPSFNQTKVKPFKTTKLIIDGAPLYIRTDSFNDYTDFVRLTKGIKTRAELGEALGQKITAKTKSIWHPYKPHRSGNTTMWFSNEVHTPRFPVYIVSKGRSKSCITHRALNRMGVPHYVVVEESEVELYKNELTDNATILALPQEYLDGYDTCDDLGSSKSKGPGAARNFCIDHSMNNGFTHHWVMDDNLDDFHRLTENEKRPVRTGATLKAAEDFVLRFSNVPLAGLNYYSFAKKNDALPPFITNTRIYSCLFMDNTSGYRWRGRYNEDTDLSLRILKDGLCTIQFNAFLCGKVTTQRMKGGNTQEFYDNEGTYPKSKMLEELHPDCAKVVWKFNRWHHHVNYKKFTQELEPRGYVGYVGVNEYGMELRET